MTEQTPLTPEEQRVSTRPPAGSWAQHLGCGTALYFVFFLIVGACLWVVPYVGPLLTLICVALAFVPLATAWLAWKAERADRREPDQTEV